MFDLASFAELLLLLLLALYFRGRCGLLLPRQRRLLLLLLLLLWVCVCVRTHKGVRRAQVCVCVGGPTAAPSGLCTAGR